jgi:6-phosphogluconolactonase/glucosamine-6-phosphate isomerase/deaminase
MAVPAPTHIEPHVERVTLQPRILEPAGHVMVMVPGRAKAAVVRDVLRGRDEQQLPAQHAVRPNATWLLDRESAAALD